jgi:hypothetical protein
MDWPTVEIARPCQGKSGAPKKVMKSDTNRFGNPHRRVHGNIFLPAFNPADVHRRQFRLFRQSFLRQTSLAAQGSDGFPKDSSMLRNGVHSHSGKQQPHLTAIKYMINSLANKIYS